MPERWAFRVYLYPPSRKETRQKDAAMLHNGKGIAKGGHTFALLDELYHDASKGEL